MKITYAYLKELYYDDGFKVLSADIIEKINNTLNVWYGQSDFDTVEKITGVDIWNCPENDDIEDKDLPTTKDRSTALEEAEVVWNKLSTEEKFGKFIEESDDATEFIECVQQI